MHDFPNKVCRFQKGKERVWEMVLNEMHGEK